VGALQTTRSNPPCPPTEYCESEIDRRQKYAHAFSSFVFVVVAYCGVMLGLAGAPCVAQEEAPAPATAPSPGTAALVDQASAMESQIAALLRQKNAASTPAPTVDLQLDLKILERWLLLRAADAGDDENMRDAAALRVAQVQSTGDLLLERIGTNRLSMGQADALSKIHQFTFKLPPLKTVAAMDDACKTIALNLLLAANPTPAEAQNLPQMRPVPISVDSPRTASASQTLSELNDRIKELRVSEPLRAELQRLAASAASQRDGQELKQTLATAVGLAQTLERGAGIDPTARPKIEQQLADALVLYGDSRTRDAGKARVTALDQYRRSLAGVQSLKIPPALQARLAPALVWAANSIEHGAQVIGWIDQYVSLCARADAAAAPAASQRRVLEPMQKRFATERAAFLDEAQLLSGNPAISAPSTLENHLTQMKRLLSEIEAVEQLPHALQTLATFHVRPGGALERRANLAMTDLGGLKESGKEPALRFITDTVHLAQLAEEMAGPLKNVPPEVAKGYTHDRLAAVEARRATLVADLGSMLAAGKTLDRADFNKLQTLKNLLDALPEAAAFELAMQKVDLLNRWADWSIPADRLRRISDPYRESTAAAFDGFATDNSTPIGRWPVIHQMYSPLLAFVTRESQYADACSRLPTGLFAQIAKLLTPMNDRPFKIERYASFAVGIWAHDFENGDYTSANAMIDTLIARLKTEQ
jgi:hypothetical protein